MNHVILGLLDVSEVRVSDEHAWHGFVQLRVDFMPGTSWRSRRAALLFLTLQVELMTPEKETWDVEASLTFKNSVDTTGHVSVKASADGDAAKRELGRALVVLEKIARVLK